MPVRRLSSVAELVAAAADDVYLRCQFGTDGGAPAPAVGGVAGWADGDAVAYIRRRPEGRPPWLVAVGSPAAAASLVPYALAEVDVRPAGLTVPLGTSALLPAGLRPVDADDWVWWWTDSPPAAQPGEEAVTWLAAGGAGELQELRELLNASSPRYSAEPGARSVRRWCGIRDVGALVACAAHVEPVPGVPHLASIATRPDRRRRGLGTAVTAWVTRRLVAESGICTLGSYADNAAAASVYARLGYRDSHRFTSGSLPPVTPR